MSNNNNNNNNNNKLKTYIAHASWQNDRHELQYLVTHSKPIPALWFTVTESCKFIISYLTKALCFSHEWKQTLIVPLRR